MKMTTEQKIRIIVEAQMPYIKKLKKVELFEVVDNVLSDYYREMSDETLDDMYYETEYGVK